VHDRSSTAFDALGTYFEVTAWHVSFERVRV